MTTGNVVELLAFVGLCAWAGDCCWYPYTMCRYCDNGKNWDSNTPGHFWKGCSGIWWLTLIGVHIGSCRGKGHKLRWEVRFLQRFGIGTKYEDPWED